MKQLELEIAIENGTKIKTLYFGNGHSYVGLIRPESQRIDKIHQYIEDALHITRSEARRYRLHKDNPHSGLWTPWDHTFAQKLLFYGDVSGKVYVPHQDKDMQFDSYKGLYHHLSHECGSKLLKVE